MSRKESGHIVAPGAGAWIETGIAKEDDQDSFLIRLMQPFGMHSRPASWSGDVDWAIVVYRLVFSMRNPALQITEG